MKSQIRISILQDSKAVADQTKGKKPSKPRASQAQANGPSKSKGQSGAKSGGKDASERQAEMRENLLEEENKVVTILVQAILFQPWFSVIPEIRIGFNLASR